MSHVVAADHEDEVAIARGACWALAPTPRVGPARKASCRTWLWSLIALDGLPERASEAKIAFAQLFSLLNFHAGVVCVCEVHGEVSPGVNVRAEFCCCSNT